MATNGDKSRMGIKRWVNSNTIGGAFLVVAILLSLAKAIAIHHKLFDPNKSTVRIAHWQLELGYRDAMDLVIANYLALHSNQNLEVLKMPVT